MTEPDGPNTPSLARFIADAAPELWTVGIAGALQIADVDPITSGLTASAIGLALRFDRHRFQHAVGRAGFTTHLAAERLGGQEHLERLATADDYRRELTARVLLAAARTPLERKLPALATVLANGLGADGDVDEALVLAAALDDLEAPHVRVLELLDSEAIGPGLTARANEDGAADAVGWEEDEIAQRLRAVVVGPQLVRTLDRHALIRDASRGTYFDLEGGTRYTVSTLGQQVLQLLRDQD